jgi:molecular chaperone DnaK
LFKAGESLKAGSARSLNFKLWEGEIEDPITDNRPIGVLKISGSDFDNGVIPAGADLACEYEILDSGNIVIEVSVPCIGSTFHSGRNFYSRQEGQLDYTSASLLVAEEGERTLNRIDEINTVVDDPKLEQARQKLDSAISLDPQEADPETVKQADENIHAAHTLLHQVRKEHLKEIRQIDLNGVVEFFDEHIREHARPSEATTFDTLARTAQRSIDRNDKDFENHLDDLKGKNFEILWRQDWFVVEQFKTMVNSPYLFPDKHRFEELSKLGMQLMRSDDIDKLRPVVAQLFMIKIGGGPDNEMFDAANIIRG